MDGGTMAVGTSFGEVHLWSTLPCSCPSLKSCCRLTINGQSGSKRKEIRHLPLSPHLISYLMYKDDTIKWILFRVVFLWQYKSHGICTVQRFSAKTSSLRVPTQRASIRTFLRIYCSYLHKYSVYSCSMASSSSSPCAYQFLHHQLLDECIELPIVESLVQFLAQTISVERRSTLAFLEASHLLERVFYAAVDREILSILVIVGTVVLVDRNVVHSG